MPNTKLGTGVESINKREFAILSACNSEDSDLNERNTTW